MAISKVIDSVRMTIEVQTGTTTEGKPILKTISYGNIKPTAGDAQVYAVAASLGAMQKYPVTSIRLTDAAQLVNA